MINFVKVHTGGDYSDCEIFGPPGQSLEITRDHDDYTCYHLQGPDYSLHITNVRWYDSGCYKCLIDGKVACQSEVTVIASQQAETSIGAPTFLSRPEPRVVEVGDDIVLSCTSDGMPAPTVRWEKDGEGILIHLGNNPKLFYPF